MTDKANATCRKIHVTGRVQGVGFRAWTQDQAHELGVTGWVRNNPDGSVTALACGDTETLKRFGERLQDGPVAASVDELRTETADQADAPPSGFSIHK
ncbi:acylphosphatase [Notoacmeibacter ruber]|uniref:Acylphosphatase n=1 Tax=Notoacmeibacter ruber TaxID=2670375 RepID=A0A3L7JCD1_9HYPH|nr:acylphosphatase [Notoacmeibacter ruber]RLQ88316.1 acylphosphatase [Notoacmeibacter ruber]